MPRVKRIALALVPGAVLAVGAFLAVGAVLAATAGPGGGGADGPREPLLLALGDSVAAGVGAEPGVSGYPELLADRLSGGSSPSAGASPRRAAQFEVENLAVGGATTASLLSQQLPAALALIEQRQADRDPDNDVEVITLTVGGNDVFGPVVAACVLDSPSADCQRVTQQQLAQVGPGVTAGLQQLTAAAGRDVDVVVTTYDNPVPSCSLAAVPGAAALAEVVLEGGSVVGLLTLDGGLNDVVRTAAAATGAQVADLHGELGPGDFVGGRDCLHPNAAGHAVIADVVSAALAR